MLPSSARILQWRPHGGAGAPGQRAAGGRRKSGSGGDAARGDDGGPEQAGFIGGEADGHESAHAVPVRHDPARVDFRQRAKDGDAGRRAPYVLGTRAQYRRIILSPHMGVIRGYADKAHEGEIPSDRETHPARRPTKAMTDEHGGKGLLAFGL